MFRKLLEIPEGLYADITRWIKLQPVKPRMTPAIIYLLRKGLEVETKSRKPIEIKGE